MANVIAYQRHWQRRGTAAALTAANEVLYAGEWCLETDTGHVKIGDGSTAWNSLDYFPLLAEDMPYNNAGSGLAANDVQEAIDELAASAGGGGGGGNTDPRIAIVDPAYDMLWKPPTSASAAVGASYPWAMNYNSGTHSITAIDGGLTAPGVWRLSVTGVGGVGISQGTVANIALGGGAIVIPYRFRIPTLSDVTDTFAVQFGLADNILAGTNLCIASYRYNQNSGALRLFTTAAGVSTVVDGSGGALAANTWVSGRLEINAAGTQVNLYQGVTLIATSTTNIPTASMVLFAIHSKTVGAAATRTVDFDYLGPADITFATPR